ncbi:MAG: DUF503 domain-containing protein [Candidatus Omnitrophica bacterium]|nr:DUF503 domain-containing protein [Candidatus Omnitrophota bacterium]
MGHIGILYIYLFIPHAQSLKDKRSVLKRLKEKTRLKFNVSIAEIDFLDKWQRSLIGIVMIGNDQRFVNEALDNILKFVEAYHAAEVTEHSMEFI